MKISQREALRLRKRVEELERVECDRRSRWVRSYPGGTHLGGITRTPDWLTGRIDAARMLKHAVVATQNEHGHIDFYALPLGEP